MTESLSTSLYRDIIRDMAEEAKKDLARLATDKKHFLDTGIIDSISFELGKPIKLKGFTCTMVYSSDINNYDVIEFDLGIIGESSHTQSEMIHHLEGIFGTHIWNEDGEIETIILGGDNPTRSLSIIPNRKHSHFSIEDSKFVAVISPRISA